MKIFFIILIIIIILLFSLYVYSESKGYHVVRYIFKDSRLVKDKTVIVFISDLHNKQYGTCNKDVLDDIEKINPDFVILAGDMITSCMEKWAGFEATIEFIKKLALKYPVYYGIGNHEERLKRRPEKYPEGAYSMLTKALNDVNAPLMDDVCVSLDDYGIDIYGLNLEHKYYRKLATRTIPEGYLEGRLNKPDKSKYSILIAHNPEHFKQYAKWGADLTLSGHVHGGIIRLPFLGGVISPALKLFPKYDGGKFKEGMSYMVLSRGLGSHTVPIRINNKAELIQIDLIKEQNGNISQT